MHQPEYFSNQRNAGDFQFKPNRATYEKQARFLNLSKYNLSFLATPFTLIFQFRKSAYDEWRINNFHELVDPRLLISSANNPLEFVASGYEMSPFDSLKIFMKLHADPNASLKLTISTISGEFPSLEGMQQVQKIESKTGELKYHIKMANAQFINKLFDDLVYSSRQYDSRSFTDYVTVMINGDVEASASFPIKKRAKMFLLIMIITPKQKLVPVHNLKYTIEPFCR